MDDFAFSLAVSVFAVALLLTAFPGIGFSPVAALFLLALSQAGFFALQALHKSGLPSPRAEYLFAGVLFVCFLAGALATGASLRTMLSFAPLPFALFAPSVASLSKSYFS